MIFLAILFLIAAAVWMVPLVNHGRLTDGIALLLLSGTVLGPKFFYISGPIQISLDRVLWVVLIGLAIIGLRLGKLKFPSLTRVDVCLLVLVAYLFQRSRGGDLIETRVDPTSRWLFYIAMPVGVYCLARIANFRQRDFRRMLHVLIGLGIYLSFTAVCEIKGYGAFVFPKYIMDPEHWMFYGRGRGPLLNPAGNGFVIGISMSAVAACFVGADRRGKALYAAIGVVLLIGVYATLTRSCWIGIAASVAIVGLVFSPRWVRVIGLAATILLAGAMTMGLKEQLLSLKRDKNLSAAESAKSVKLRPLLATVAWEMFKDRPLAGHGYGQYFQRHDQYHTIREHGVPLESVRVYSHHNVFLAFLVDSGLIGLFLFSVPLIVLAAHGWQMARDGNASIDRRRVGLMMIAILACYFPNAMFHNMTIIPMVQMFLLATSGMAMAIYQNGFARDEAVIAPVIARREALA